MERFLTWGVADFVKLYEDLDHPPRHTLTAFKTSLGRVAKIYAPEPFESLRLSFLGKPEEVIARLEHHAYSHNSIYATMSAIGKLIGIVDAPLGTVRKIQAVLKKLRSDRDEQEREQLRTMSQQDNWIPHSTLLATLDAAHDRILASNSASQVRNYLMTSLFVRQSPVRAGNYIDCVLLNDMKLEDARELDPGHNYLLETPEGALVFIFNRYKTAKTYGQLVRVVEDPKLAETLHHYLTEFAADHTHLFWSERSKSETMNENTFSKTLTRTSEQMFGKKLSVNLYRHIYITDFLETNPALKDKLLLASDMGHSFFQQELYRKVA